MSDDKKVIRITCAGADMISLKELEVYQDSLKWLEKTQYEKLKQSIITDGFHDPIHIWRKSGENKPRKILDGTQRRYVLRQMIEKEGYELPDGKLPIVWVIAETEKQAKRIILEKMSQYGKYDEDSVYKFIHEAELDWPELKPMVDWPSIHLGKFEKGWFDGAWEPQTPKGQADGQKMQEIMCPSCGHSFEVPGS